MQLATEIAVDLAGGHRDQSDGAARDLDESNNKSRVKKWMLGLRRRKVQKRSRKKAGFQFRTFGAVKYRRAVFLASRSLRHARSQISCSLRAIVSLVQSLQGHVLSAS